MYVRGRERSDVQKWVDTVHDLRYKDYQLVAPVEAVPFDEENVQTTLGALEEVDTVKEMAAHMEAQGLQKWWRVAMGFIRE